MKIADLFVDLHLDTSAFDKQLKSTLARASAQDVKVGVDIDTRSAIRSVSGLDKNIKSATSGINTFTGRISLMADALLLLAPAGAAVAAVAVPAVVALGQAAIVGAGAAGTMLLAFQGVGDAVTAVNKASLEPTTANLQAMQQALAQLSPEAQAFVGQIISLGDEFDQLKASAGEGLFPGIISGIDSASARLPELNSLVQTFGQTLGDIAARSGEALASDRWNVLFEYLSSTAGPTLNALADSFGNVAHGAVEILQAFQPLSQGGFNWVRDVTADFDRWATSLDSSEGFQEFSDYVRQVGPQLVDTVGALAEAFVAIGTAAAPLAGPVLSAIEGIANALAAVAGSDIGGPLIAAAIAMRTFSRASQIAAPAMSALSVAVGDFQKNAGGTGSKLAALASGAKGLAGPAGLAGLAVSATSTNEALNVLGTTASGALLGFSVGGPVGAAIGGAVGLFAGLAIAQHNSTDEMSKWDAEIQKGTTDFGAFKTIALDAGSALAASSATAAESQRNLSEALKGGKDGILSQSEALAAGMAATSQYYTDTSSKVQKLSADQKDAIENYANLTAGVTNLGHAMGTVPLDQTVTDTEEMNRVFQAAVPTLNAIGVSYDDWMKAVDSGSTDKIITDMQRYVAETDSAAGRTRTLAESVKGLDSTILTTADSATAFATAIQSMVVPSLNLGQAQDDLQRSFHAMTASARENGTILRGNSEAALNNRDAVRGQIAQIIKVAESQAAAGRSAKTIAGTLANNTAAFRRNAEAAGFNAGKIQQLSKQYGLTPNLVRTVIEAAGVDRAIAQSKNLKNQFNSLPKKVRTDIATNGVPKSKAEISDLESRTGKLTKSEKRIVMKLQAEAAKTGITDVSKLLERIGKKNVQVKIKADGSAAISTIKKADGAADKLKSKKVEVKLDGDPGKFMSAVRTATSAGKKFASTTFEAKIDADPSGAVSGAATARAALASVQSKTVTITVNTVKTGSANAEGGYISGPGTATSDSIPAWLSDGEYVVKNAAVKKYGAGMMDRINSMSFARGGLVSRVQKFASGGIAKLAGGGKAAAGNRAQYLFDLRLQDLLDFAEAGNLAGFDKAIAFLKKARDKTKRWSDEFVTLQNQIRDVRKQKQDAVKGRNENQQNYFFDRRMEELLDAGAAGNLGAFDTAIDKLQHKMSKTKRWSDEFVQLKQQIDDIRQQKQDALQKLSDNKASYYFDKQLSALLDAGSEGNLGSYDQAIAMLRQKMSKLRAWSDEWVQLQQQIDQIKQQQADALQKLSDNRANYYFDRQLTSLLNAGSEGDLGAYDRAISLLRQKLASLQAWSDEYVQVLQQIDQIIQQQQDARKKIQEALADFQKSIVGDFFSDGIGSQIKPGADFRSILGGIVSQAKALLEMGAIGAAAYNRIYNQAVKYTQQLEKIQKALDANAKAQEVANEKLQEAETRLQAAQAAWDGLKDSAKSAISTLSSFGESGAAASLDEAQKIYDATLKKYGAGSANTAEAARRLEAARVTPASIVAKLQGNLQKARAFAGNIKKLISMGLNKAAIQEILGMGPIEGAIYADALTKALPSQIQSINAIQSEIDQIGESLGISFAEKFAGDELRNAQMGKQIAQGILDGLKAEQARLEAQMTSLGNAMAEAFKRALGIRSPSMVFKKLGSQTMQGLQIGIERETGGVIGALPRLDQSFSTIPGRVPHASVNAPSAHPAQAGPMVNIERVEVHEQVSMQVLTHRLDGWVRQAGRLR